MLRGHGRMWELRVLMRAGRGESLRGGKVLGERRVQGWQLGARGRWGMQDEQMLAVKLRLLQQLDVTALGVKAWVLGWIWGLGVQRGVQGGWWRAVRELGAMRPGLRKLPGVLCWMQVSHGVWQGWVVWAWRSRAAQGWGSWWLGSRCEGLQMRVELVLRLHLGLVQGLLRLEARLQLLWLLE